jgi:cell division septal protein FtsQ
MNREHLTLVDDETDVVLSNLKQQKKQLKNKQRKLRIKRLFLFLGVLLIVLVVTVFMLLSPSTKIQSISFSSPMYLSERFVLDKLDLSYQDNYYLTSPLALEFRFADLKLFKIQVIKNPHRSILIDIKPANILGYYEQNSKIYFLMTNSESILYQPEYQNLLGEFPFLTDFHLNDEVKQLAILMKSLDQHVIQQISEVERFATTYDQNMIELTMEDGNRVFVTEKSLSLINEYESVVKELKKQHVCIFFYTSNQKSTAYTDVCPE